MKKENERFVKTESKEQIQKDRKSNRPSEKQRSKFLKQKKDRSQANKNQIDIHDASQQLVKEIHLVNKAKDPIKKAKEKCKKAVKSRSGKEFVQRCRNGGNQ